MVTVAAPVASANSQEWKRENRQGEKAAAAAAAKKLQSNLDILIGVSQREDNDAGLLHRREGKITTAGKPRERGSGAEETSDPCS